MNEPDSLRFLVEGLQGNLSWILILIVSAAVMQLVTITVLLMSKKRGRSYHYGHDRRPGMPLDAGGKPGKGRDGAPRRGDAGKDGGRDGSQRKLGDGNRGGGQRQGGRQDGRSQQERGNRPSQSSMDPMELSLRDINQRLKNAEREQDSVRRSFKDGDGRDGESRGRDGRPQQRSDRDGRGGNRDDRPPRRDSNRDNRGGRPERQDRGDGGRPQQEYDRLRRTEEPRKTEPEAQQAPEIVPNDTGFSEDQLQHGRRFTAKRRMLPDGAGSQEAPEQQQFQAAQEGVPPQSTTDSFNEQERGGNEDIQFGR